MMDLNSKLEKCMGQRENLSSFIQCFPLGIICGRPNSELAETVQLKINEKLGTEITVKFLFDKEQNFCEKVDTVVNSYEEKIRCGILEMQTEYFIPVLIDEESLEKNTVSKSLEKVCQTLRQRGYKWHICYYLIIDRTVSQKEVSLEAGLEKLWEKHDYRGSIGVFEPNTIDDHAVRAIVFHILLQVLERQTIPYERFILGCWKLDAEKQCLTACLQKKIEFQNQSENETKFKEQVQFRLEEMVPDHMSSWKSAFFSMPVHYDFFEQFGKGNIWEERKASYRNLLKLLYGRENVFEQFLEENVKRNNENEIMREFLNRQDGNLYEIKKLLKNRVKEIKGDYQKKIDEAKIQKEKSLEYPIILKKRGALKSVEIEELLEKLWNGYWKQEANIFVWKQRYKILELTEEYLQSNRFQAEIEQIEEKNKNILGQLTMIQRECCNLQIDVPETLQNKIPDLKWKDFVSDEKYLDELEHLYTGRIDFWMGLLSTSDIGKFVQQLNDLKSKRPEIYYSAKLKPQWDVDQKRYLYIKTLDHGKREDLNTKLKYESKLYMEECDWETENSADFLVYRKIDSLDEVDRGQEER